MVDAKNVHKQLKKLKFGASPWNQAELRELPHILHEHEQIAECVNGFYEGGVALLVATDMRILLIDKKPLNYLNVEDLRFDMINEIDYSHRLIGATIIISTGSKTLKFKSYNQPRLRSLINLIQERMSLSKKEQSDKAENQQQHLEEINKQLQMYLLAQHQHLQQQIQSQADVKAEINLPKPDAQLADYLFAQRLLEKFQKENGDMPTTEQAPVSFPSPPKELTNEPAPTPAITQQELVADAKREVFASRPVEPTAQQSPSEQVALSQQFPTTSKGIEISALGIAYSKLPMMLRNRKFGRPSLHAHSRQQEVPTGQPLPIN